MFGNYQLQTWQRRETFSFYPRNSMCTERVATQLLLISTQKKTKKRK